jgi:lambda family phage tail tape measure protein
MADVATLGLAVDSSQVKTATGDLNKLTVASNSAEQAQQRIKTASGQVGVTFKTVQTMADRAGVSFDEMKKSLEGNTAAHGKMTAASTTAVRGMQALSQQAVRASNDNTNLAQTTDKTSSSVDRLGQKFTKGLIAGFAIQGVRDLARYLVELNTQLAATADAASMSNIGGKQFQGLQSGASSKGINNTDFNAAMVGFNQQVNQAKQGVGELRTVLTANGKTVSDSAKSFGDIADLVKDAKGNAALQASVLTQAQLPATREWINYMQQGSAEILKQAAGAKTFSDAQLAQQKKINDGWNQIVSDFQQSMKSLVVSFSEFPAPGSQLAGLVDMVKGGRKWSIDFDIKIIPGSPADWLIKNWVKLGQNMGIVAPNAPMPNITPGGPTTPLPANPVPAVQIGPKIAPPVDPTLLKQQISLEQQRIGILGPLATVEDQVRAKQLEINAASLSNVGISKAQAAALLDITRAQAEMARVQQQAQIGVFDFAAAQKAANDNLKALVDQKLLDPNNPAQWAAANNAAAKSVENLANQAKVAGAPLEQLQRLANDAGSARTQLDQFSTTTLNSLSDNLVNIANGSMSASEAFKNFGLSVVTALEKMIIQLLIIAPLAKALQGFFGVGLFSDGGYVNPGSSSNPLPGLTAADYGAGFATGGYTGSGGKYQPAGIVHAGEYVFDAASTSRIGVSNLERLRRTLPGFADGGYAGNVVAMPGKGQDNQPLVFNYSPNIDARGADAQAVARLATAQANDRKNFENNVKAVMVRYRSNTPGA